MCEQQCYKLVESKHDYVAVRTLWVVFVIPHVVKRPPNLKAIMKVM